MEPYLFEGDGWLPTFVFVQYRKTDGSGWIHVGMEEGRGKFTYNPKSVPYYILNLYVVIHFGGLLG